MEVDGWPYPIVVDLPGAKFVKSTSPVLMRHNRRLRLGHTTSQEISTGKKGKITAEGVVSRSSKAAQGFVADARQGFPFEVSIGARVLEAEFVDAGETVVVNDRTVKGPVYVARKTLIRELTVDVLRAAQKLRPRLPLPKRGPRPCLNSGSRPWASIRTRWAKIEQQKARGFFQRSGRKQKALPRGFEARQETAKGRGQGTEIDPDDDDGDNGSALAKQRDMEASESERVDMIRSLFARYPEVSDVDPDPEGSEKKIKAATFKGERHSPGPSPERVELVLMRASMPGGASEGPAIHIKAPCEGPVYRKALTAAVCRDVFGMKASYEKDGTNYGYERQFSEEALEASMDRRIRRPGLHRLMDLTIEAAEGLPFSGDRKSTDFGHAYVEAAIKLQGGPRYSYLRASRPVFDTDGQLRARKRREQIPRAAIRDAGHDLAADLPRQEPERLQAAYALSP